MAAGVTCPSKRHGDIGANGPLPNRPAKKLDRKRDGELGERQLGSSEQRVSALGRGAGPRGSLIDGGQIAFCRTPPRALSASDGRCVRARGVRERKRDFPLAAEYKGSLAMQEIALRASLTPSDAMFKSVIALAALAASAAAHYTFPSLVVNGTTTPAWVNVRQTNNFNSQAPVTDVTSLDLRCYDTQTNPTATTITVAAGQQLGIMSDGTIYHPGVVNVYMARAPGDVNSFAGDGAVWFKVYQISAVTNGGQSITFPAEGVPGVTFTLPHTLPSGQYLVRMEAIALHVAQTFGGAQFYISCGQVNVVNGGSGTPGPLVSIPGVYTGNEPGILININYPIPKNYTQPGPAVWSG